MVDSSYIKKLTAISQGQTSRADNREIIFI